MTMTRMPLMFGHLNDGIEPQYPGTDIPTLGLYAQAIAGCELDRRLDVQLPEWETFQGPADDEDTSTLGVGIAPGLMTVQGVFWTALTARTRLLIVRADYHGCPVSLASTKRPGRAHADLWPDYDTALGNALRAEVTAGRYVGCGIDANQAAYTLPGMTWTAPHPTSVVGVLTTRGVIIPSCTQLPATGEHAPVLAWLRLPIEP